MRSRQGTSEQVPRDADAWRLSPAPPPASAARSRVGLARTATTSWWWAGAARLDDLVAELPDVNVRVLVADPGTVSVRRTR